MEEIAWIPLGLRSRSNLYSVFCGVIHGPCRDQHDSCFTSELAVGLSEQLGSQEWTIPTTTSLELMRLAAGLS